MSLAFNLYAVLGVTVDASLAELIAAYRQLAPKCHPNSTVYDPATFPMTHLTQEQYWLALGEAMEVLTNRQLRCHYNLNTLKVCYPEYEFSGNCMGIFQQYFPNIPRLVAHCCVPEPNPVLRLVLSVTVEDIFFGNVKKITYSRMQRADGESRTCLQTLSVLIHPYMRHGTLITVKDFGHETEHGPSDVLVRLDLLPHPMFTVFDKHLVSNMRVPLSTALFGGTVKVQTIDSKQISIYVQPSQCQVVRFEAEGLHAATGRGDLFVCINATLPTVPAHLHDDAERIIREIERAGSEPALEEQ